MAEQNEPKTGEQQQVATPAPAPMAPDEVRRKFVEAAEWARIPLLATDGTGKTTTALQNITQDVEDGKTLTPAQIQQTKDAIKLLDSNEIVNGSPRLQMLKDTFAVLSTPAGQQQVQQPAAPVAKVVSPAPKPEAEVPQVVAPTPAAAPAQAQAKPKATAAPEAKPVPVDDERDNFIRNALPVAAALRKSGKPEEAKQLEQVANAILQTKSMERTPAPVQEQAPAKEQSIKDMLANVYKAIDQDPALKNMPEAQAMRRASDALDKEGMLNITVRNGIVVSFVSNFTDNFSRTQQAAPAAQVKPAAAQAAPAPQVVAPAPAAKVEADPKAKVATVLVTSANDSEPGKSKLDVLSNRFREAGATVEVVSTKPTPKQPDNSTSELKVTYRLDQPEINKVSALLDAAAVMPGSKLQEVKGDQLARKEAASQADERQAQQARQQRDAEAQQQQQAKQQEQQAQQQAEGRARAQQLTEQPSKFQAYPAYELYAPTTDTGVVETRKIIPTDNPHMNVAMSRTGEFGINPNVGQQRLIGDGISTLGKFFEYALPTSGHKIAHVGLAEPGKMQQTEKGWEVVTKGKLAITDTQGNVFKPEVGPAQAIAPTPEVKVAQQAPVQQPAPQQAPVQQRPAQGADFAISDVPTELLAKMGVPVAELERTGQLQKLLEGKKTDLIQGFKAPGEGGQPTTFAGKLVLTRDDQGAATLRVELPKKELAAVQTIALPKEVYGAKLSPEQQKSLLEGKPTRVEGMTRPGENQLVSALVQLDPVKQALVFRETTPRQVPEQVITQAQTPPARRQGVRM